MMAKFSYVCKLSANVVNLIILGLLAMPATASNSPELGNSTRQILSATQEQLIGQNWFYSLQQANIIYQDPIVHEYINHLGNRLTTHINTNEKIKFNFFVVDSNDINAFAFLGGNIGSNVGLILATNTESELAAILAHEISHITQKHALRQLIQQQQLAPITVAQAIAAIAAGVPDLIVPILSIHSQQILKYSREYEQEADRMGIILLNKAGYDPDALPNVFENMSNQNRYQSAPPEYLSTHPIYESRIADARNRSRKANYHQFADHIDYHLIKARLLVQTSNDKPKLLTILQNNLNNNKYHNLTATNYALSLTLQELNKTNQAIKIATELAEKHPDNIIIQTSLAKLIAHNNPTAAKQLLEPLMHTYAAHLPLAISYAKILITLEQYATAQRILQPFNLNNLTDSTSIPKLYEMLMQCAQKLQQPTKLYEAQAKLLIITSEYHQAMSKIELGMQHSKQNHLQLTRFTTLKKELEQLMEAKKL